MENLYPFKRVLVTLDRSVHDEALFAYTSILAEITNLDVIYFVHISESLDLPEEIKEKYPDLLAPIDESIKKNIRYDIDHLTKTDHTKTEILVREGDPLKEILKLIDQKAIDLLIMGRKNDNDANLKLIKKVVRSIPCSISLIPEYIPHKINKILVPVDFSDHSCLTLQAVQVLAENYPEMEVELLHIYDVPTGHTKIGKSYDEFRKIMKENAIKDGERFFKKYPCHFNNLKSSYVCQEKKNMSKLIFQYAVSNNIDTLIIGARGRGGLSHLFLGSVTEDLIEHNDFLPLFIIKSKKDIMGIKEAIGKL